MYIVSPLRYADLYNALLKYVFFSKFYYFFVHIFGTLKYLDEIIGLPSVIDHVKYK